LLEAEQIITGISCASSAHLTIAFHGFAVGDLIFIDGVAGDMGALLNDRQWTVTAVIDANTVVINSDTSGCAAFAGCVGGTANAAPPAVVTPPPVPPPATTPTAPNVFYGGGLGRNRQRD
jgi:hypothetical protein